MIDIRTYDRRRRPAESELHEIAGFLFRHLDEFGDPQHEIEQAIRYSLESAGDKPGGGLVLAAYSGDMLAGAVVINRTGMSGYIPENILVYIATHNELRGKGIGRMLMQKAIGETEGDIALHVEADNPAKRLYESLGFTNRYLEMRLKKNK